MLAFYVDKEVRARESWELGENRCTKGSRSLHSLLCFPQCIARLEGCPLSSRLKVQSFTGLTTAVNAWLEKKDSKHKPEMSPTLIVTWLGI